MIKIIHHKIISLSLILCLCITGLFTLSSFADTAHHTQNAEWELTITLSEPSGIHDYVVLGEAIDAGDGNPPDLYDIPKPPLYLPPFIRCWFDDALSPPYDCLSHDYRHFPDDEKQWNLSIQWTPNDYTSSTNITINWNHSEILDIPYSYIQLRDEHNVLLADLTTTTQYTFECPAMIPQHFQIYALNISYLLHTNITGKGDLSINPELPNYFPNTMVDIQATPKEGWLFSHWTGSIQSTDEQIQICMDEDKQLNAFFILNDTTPPELQISHPQPGLYLFDHQLFKYHLKQKSRIIGDITINVEAQDYETGVSHIDLFIDNQFVVSTPNDSLTYRWERDRIHFLNHHHVIEVVVYDDYGNTASQHMRICKWL